MRIEHRRAVDKIIKRMLFALLTHNNFPKNVAVMGA